MKNTLFNFALKMREEGAYLFDNEYLLKYVDDYVKNNKLKTGNSKKDPVATPEIIEVVEHLNKSINKKFSPHTKETIKFVGARLKKHSIETLKKVIDLKVKHWKGDERMFQYLCPGTLFNESKFEKYLNEIPTYPEKNHTLGFEVKVDNVDYINYVNQEKLKGNNFVSYKEWVLNQILNK